MSIPDFLPYVQFFGQFALIGAASFAGYQLILHRRERVENAALEVLTNLQTPEFRTAYAHVWTLPLAAPADEVRDRDDGMVKDVECVAMTFESIGVMVYNRIVPLEIVDDVIGGFLRESWRRLEPYVLDQRRRLDAPRYAEWYQWLGDRVEVRRKRRKVPAYEAFKGWKE